MSERRRLSPMIARPSCSTSPRPRSNAMASAPAPSNGSPSGQASLRSSSTSISALACRCSGHSSNERMLAINPPFGPASPRLRASSRSFGFRRCQPRSLVRRQRDRPAPGRPRTCGPARRPLARRRRGAERVLVRALTAEYHADRSTTEFVLRLGSAASIEAANIGRAGSIPDRDAHIDRTVRFILAGVEALTAKRPADQREAVLTS